MGEGFLRDTKVCVTVSDALKERISGHFTLL